MKPISRRRFVGSLAVAGGAGMAAGSSPLNPFARVLGANDDIRVGVIGIRGHGRTHIRGFRDHPGVRVVALCDVDEEILRREMQPFRDRHERVQGYGDLRRLLDNPDIDAIAIATPNHWHALAAIWGCQAGKDVLVEKPVSHNVFEGRQTVEAARRYERVVQADLDRRSRRDLQEAIEFIHAGQLGAIQHIFGFCYKRRPSLGRANGPQPVPDSIDYNLWLGPAPWEPLRRKTLHYEWHWVWETGNGEIGNNGPHQLDEARWALGADGLPPKVMAFGGRFGYEDDGETPNTLVAILDYPSVPLIYEVRGLPVRAGENLMDAFRTKAPGGAPVVYGKESPNPNTGVLVQCEGGYIKEEAAFDNTGKQIRQFSRQGELSNHQNFIRAVRSRKITDLKTDILEGHLSTALAHLANASYRLGQQASLSELRRAVADRPLVAERLESFARHLSANNIDLDRIPITVGPWLEVDSRREQFVGGTFPTRWANALLTRDYREPFVVPKRV